VSLVWENERGRQCINFRDASSGAGIHGYEKDEDAGVLGEMSV
jgi:hypothetical protein